MKVYTLSLFLSSLTYAGEKEPHTPVEEITSQHHPHLTDIITLTESHKIDNEDNVQRERALAILREIDRSRIKITKMRQRTKGSHS